jgi:hypothetical protein
MKQFLSLCVGFLFLIPVSYAAWSQSYPGCGAWDIIVGEQIWASCNAVGRGEGSDNFSGWFGWGQTLPILTSINGRSTLYEGITRAKSSSTTDWSRGPCASGYRIPTRYEWEDVILNARRNNSSVATLLKLPLNGAKLITRDKKGNITGLKSINYEGSYWTSSSENIPGRSPMIMHIGQSYGYSKYDGTESSISNTGYEWKWNENGKELVERSMDEVANVRCIRDL